MCSVTVCGFCLPSVWRFICTCRQSCPRKSQVQPKIMERLSTGRKYSRCESMTVSILIFVDFVCVFFAKSHRVSLTAEIWRLKFAVDISRQPVPVLRKLTKTQPYFLSLHNTSSTFMGYIYIYCTENDLCMNCCELYWTEKKTLLLHNWVWGGGNFVTCLIGHCREGMYFK